MPGVPLRPAHRLTPVHIISDAPSESARGRVPLTSEGQGCDRRCGTWGCRGPCPLGGAGTMRRTARLLTGTALAVAVAGLAAAPVYGGDTGSLEVFPSSVVPGEDVTVNTAACGSDGTASGDAGAVGGGTFTLAASAHEHDAIGQFQVPPSAQPGTYEI